MKINDVRFALAAPNWDALPPGVWPEVAFAGRSNVGKSSLLNALCGRKQLARTSGTPGKTQALNFYAINPNEQGDPRLFLVDLPGYGYAKVAQTQRAAWQRLVGQYVTERSVAEGGRRAPLRAVVQLIDSRHPPTPLDVELMAVLMESEAAHLIVLTKADKLSANGRQNAGAAVARTLAPYGLDVPVLLTSAEKKEGLTEVWRWIETLL
jgi:GTP-binding protein